MKLPGVEYCILTFTDQPSQVRTSILTHTSVADAPLQWCNQTGTYLTSRRLNSAAMARILSVRDVAFLVESLNSTFGPDTCPSDEKVSVMT